MGGAVSAGEDNDELVDNLVEADYIKTAEVQSICRSVDRGFYYSSPREREHAYRDAAWKQGHVHLSAPCIYSQVMEAMKFLPGQSFLNIGSGTGYLSTMAGLMLGHGGRNVGIELHPDLVEYANHKLELFVRHSDSLYRYDFCEPVFLTGNALEIICTPPPDDHEEQKFDRIYCGAAVSPEFCPQVESLLSTGGVLVMPVNDQLVQVTRVSDSKFTRRNLLPVSFASLITPGTRNQNNNSNNGAPRRGDHRQNADQNPTVRFPDWQPVSLKLLCRRQILSCIRHVVAHDVPLLLSQPRFSPSQTKAGGCERRTKYPIRISRIVRYETTSDENSSDLSSAESDVMNHQLDREVASTSSSSSSSSPIPIASQSDSGVAASSFSSVQTADSVLSARGQSAPSDPAGSRDDCVNSENRQSKRSCSTTDEEEPDAPAPAPVSVSGTGLDQTSIDQKIEPSPSSSTSSGVSSEDVHRFRLARAIASGLRERRRIKLLRMAQESSSSSASSLSTSTSSSSSASDNRSLQPIHEDDKSDEGKEETGDDHEVRLGINLLQSRPGDLFVSGMRERIKQLPLPPILQTFVNLNHGLTDK